MAQLELMLKDYCENVEDTVGKISWRRRYDIVKYGS